MKLPGIEPKNPTFAAARRSGADNVISALPHGYDTILGKRFEDGEELSIGEWQKVALARAFMRDAQIIVLDEPTSSMDAKAEYDVFQSFRQLVSGRTAILISHRFSTVRMADRIYVLKQGSVVEGGTHEALVRAGGGPVERRASGRPAAVAWAVRGGPPTR